MSAVPRKGSYGYTVRVNLGLTASSWPDLAMRFSASGGSDSFILYASSNQVLVGASSIQSSALGVQFASGQWVYGITGSAQPFATADTYYVDVECKTSGQLFYTPKQSLVVTE